LAAQKLSTNSTRKMKLTEYCLQGAVPALVALAAYAGTPLSASAADVQKGREIFQLCVGCHTTTANDHRFGPSLAGLYNRPVGAVKGFAYSNALKHSKFRWSDARLRQWLSDEPKNMVPGTLMEFPGISNPDEVNALISYLKTLK
jgi:cytochrome c